MTTQVWILTTISANPKVIGIFRSFHKAANSVVAENPEGVWEPDKIPKYRLEEKGLLESWIRYEDESAAKRGFMKTHQLVLMEIQ